MNLHERIRGELKDAMKAGDAEKRDTLRFLESAVKNEAIEKRKPVTELSDEEVVAVVKRMAKQRMDSIESYRAGGRKDLVAKEEAELLFLKGYLPAEMPVEEVIGLVREAVTESGAVSKADFGKAMGLAMKKVAGRADGSVVKKCLEEVLQ
jgi:uncharacterized protein YqeY